MGLCQENGQRITKAAFPAAPSLTRPSASPRTSTRLSRTAAATDAPRAPAVTCSTRCTGLEPVRTRV
jgi:hypothetical protein